MCSSRKFRDEAHAFVKEVEKLGAPVLIPPLKTWTEEEWKALSDSQKLEEIKILTLNHFKKIDEADVVFVFNKHGYAGISVSLEIGYAQAKGKPIYALTKDEEHAREVLYKGYAASPQDLVKYL